MSLDQPSGIVKPQTITRDAFLDGRLNLSQPRTGFRAGLDSVVLGAAVAPASRLVLDVGSGTGAAALVALVAAPFRSAVLVDNDPEVLSLAHQNIAENGFAEMARTQLLDAASAAALPTDHFTSVIANPPYFTQGRGTSATTRGQQAREMADGGLERWSKFAVGHVAPGGEVIFIHVAERLADLLSAFAPRLGAITVLPLASRPGRAASRILVRGIKGSRAPLQLLATRAVHADEGPGYTPEFEEILRGRAQLHW